MLDTELFVVSIGKSSFYFYANPDELDQVNFIQILDRYCGFTKRYPEAVVFKRILDECEEQGCTVQAVHPLAEYILY